MVQNRFPVYPARGVVFVEAAQILWHSVNCMEVVAFTIKMCVVRLVSLPLSLLAPVLLAVVVEVVDMCLAPLLLYFSAALPTGAAQDFLPHTSSSAPLLSPLRLPPSLFLFSRFSHMNAHCEPKTTQPNPTQPNRAAARLSDEKRMGRRRAARTALMLAPQGRALSPLTPSDLVKNVPRNFATLWVGTDPAAVEVAGSADKELGGERGRTEGGKG